MEDSVIFTSDSELVGHWRKILCEQKPSKTNETYPQNVQKLFETYQRLRQVPRLVSCLHQAIASYEDEDRPSLKFEWSDETLERFAFCCQEFPPGQMFEIWTTLISGVDAMIMHIDNRKGSARSRKTAETLVKSWTDLFAVFLMHCRLLHYSSMPLSSAAKAEELMAATASQCIAPLFNLFINGSISVGRCALSLCYAWGELSLLLQQYWNKFATIRGTLKKSSYDLSYVHPTITREDWKKFSNFLQITSELSIHNMNVLLLLQKFRAIMQLKGNFDIKQESLVVTAEAVGKLIVGLDEESFEKDTVNHTWQCVLSQIPVLLPYWSLDLSLKVANKMVQLACSSTNRQLQETTILAISNLKFSEGKYFQTALVSAILANIFTVLSQTRLEDLDILSRLLCDSDLLADIDSVPTAGNICGSWIAVKEAGNILTSLLMNSKTTKLVSTSLDAHRVLQYFKILKLLPLPYLLPVNQTRCLFGVIAALFAIHRSDLDDVSLHVQVIDFGRTIIFTILDGFRSVWLFDFVNAGSVLCWLVDSQVHCTTQITGRNTELLYKTFKTCLSGLLRLSINNRGTFMETLPFFERIESLKKTFRDLTPNGKYVYIIVANSAMNLLMSVLKRSFKYTAIKDACERHLYVISRVIISMVKRLPKESVESPHVRAALLQSFAQVIVISEKLAEKQQSVKWRKYLDIAFQDAFQVLEDCLDDEILTQSSFEFMHVVLQHREECEDVFPENFVYSLWRVTVAAHTKCFQMPQRDATEKKSTVGSANNSLLAMELNTPLSAGPDNSMASAAERLFASLIVKANANELDQIIQDLSCRLETNLELDVALPQLLSTFRLLHILPFGELVLSVEKLKVLPDHFSRIIMLLPSVLYSYRHEDVCVELVLIPMLQLMGQTIVPQGKNIVCTNSLNMCIHVCVEALHLSQSTSLAVFEKTIVGVYEVFNAMLFHHKFDVIKMMPAFCSGIINLLQVVIRRSDQSKFGSEDDIDHVICACQYITRLLNCVCQGRREDFSRIAPYIVAEFVSEIQQITVLPSVKETLSTGIFSILSMCDAYSIALLQSNLAHSNRELFNELLQMYKKRKKTRTKK